MDEVPEIKVTDANEYTATSPACMAAYLNEPSEIKDPEGTTWIMVTRKLMEGTT